MTRTTVSRGASVLLLALAIATFLSFPATADLHGSWRTPILAFEFARTPTDLLFLTGDDADPVRRAMHLGHRWDALFPIAYGALLAASAIPAGRLATTTALLAIPFDWVENAALESMLNQLDAGESVTTFWPLIFATSTKWSCIAVASALIARNHRSRWDRGVGGLLAMFIGMTVVSGHAWVAEPMAVLLFSWFLTLVVRAWQSPGTHHPPVKG